jgi:Ca2+-binding RTX toxin-like protein
MAQLWLSNAWGSGIDMSGYNSDGWGSMYSVNPSGTLYQGYNNIIFDAYGFWQYDALGVNYYHDGVNYVEMEDIWYFQGVTPVQKLDDVYIQTTLTSLNSPIWNVRWNQGNDTIEGNDYADYIRGGWGSDLLIGYAGNDTILGDDGDDVLGGGSGNDYLIGGAGYDTAAYLGISANYLVTQNVDGSVTVTDKSGVFGADIISGIEAVAFENGTFAVSSLIATSPPPPPPPSAVTNKRVEGGSGSETLQGDLLHDALYGFGGNDWMYGLDGDDRLDGGTGKDNMVGGTGRDTFVFSTRPSKTTNVDKIVDFNVAADSVHLENGIFKTIGKGTSSKPALLKSGFFYAGTKSHDVDDRVIYNKKTGALYYDADGTGAGAQVQIASLSKNLKITHKDFYVI